MKRSEINATIKQFEALLDQYRFRIPPYLSFTPEEWADKNHEWDEIRDNMLGWDITDYGEGDFEHKGLALITLRNGNVKDPKYTKGIRREDHDEHARTGLPDAFPLEQDGGYHRARRRHRCLPPVQR